MIPDTLYIGSTWAFEENVDEFSADDGWKLEYILTNASKNIKLESNSESSGNTFVFKIAGTTTSGYTTGDYSVAIFAVNGDDRRFISTGCAVTIRPNIAEGDADDSRSHIQKVLDSIEAVLEGKAASDVQSYSIAGRSISRYSIAELVKWRSTYKSMLAQECNATAVRSGKCSRNKIKVEFSGPTS